MLKHLDLFSGIGGFSLAAKMVGGIETTQFVEIDPYCQQVLSKNFPGVSIHGDITTFTAKRGRFDLITGGFPCQDISSANRNGRGLEGKRSGLFYELMRIVRECRPRYIVLENVSEMLRKDGGRVMGTVLWELSQSGYDAEWQTISAASVGANHFRSRVWIVAYANGNRRQRTNSSKSCDDLQRDYSPQIKKWKTFSNPLDTGFALPFPPRLGKLSTLPGMDDGLPKGLDRNRRSQIRALGNAVVPQVAAIALQRVLQLDLESESL